jgi:serine protease
MTANTGDPRPPAGRDPGGQPSANIPVFGVPDSAMRRFGAKVLDPATAQRYSDAGEPVPDAPSLRPVVYVPDRLLVPGLPGGRFEESRGLLEEIGQEMGFEVVVRDNGFADLARELEVDDLLDASTHTPVELRNSTTQERPAIDAWSVIARARSLRGVDAVRGWSLSHVLMSSGGYWGSVGGYWGSVGGYWGSVGGYWGSVGGYWGSVGAPGVPVGRAPVVLSMMPPGPSKRHERAVAVLDTGLGANPWFDGSARVESDPTAGGLSIGLRFAPEDDPENTGVTIDRLNGFLDPMCGHGTFVAGVIRQHAADARLLVVPVVHGDGAADETDILNALNLLAARHLSGLRAGNDRPIDVINLSMGYYHEDITPDTTTGAVFSVLRLLAAEGVAIVAAAGNGSTTEKFWPAAMAADTAPGSVPVTSVGALDHNGARVALFSNSGSWVTDYRRGCNVISTMPTTLDGSVVSPVDADPRGLPPRGSGDPDRYECGFGIWSGTSFAAPVATGLIATALGDVELPSDPAQRSKVVAEVVQKALGANP